MWITRSFAEVARYAHPQEAVDKVVCTCGLLVGTSTFPQVVHNESTWLSTRLSTGVRTA